MDIQKKIPVSREILADMETPLSVYRKLADCSYSYLFESVEGGEKWARYSLIGLKARKIIKIIQNQIEILQDGEVLESIKSCLLYTSPSPRDATLSRMPSSA